MNEPFSKTASSYMMQIREAIIGVSDAVKSTEIQTVIDGLLRHLSPALADRADTMFPVSMRPHATNNERYAHPGRKNLFTFLVGDTILAFYDFYRCGRDLEDAQATNNIDETPHRAVIQSIIIRSLYLQARLDFRIGRLRAIARAVPNLILHGDESDGFYFQLQPGLAGPEREQLTNALLAVKQTKVYG